MKLSSVSILSIAIASATCSNGQTSPKTASAHNDAFDTPKELKTKLVRGGDVSLLTDAENTETAQLLKLVKDLAGQVEDMKAVVSQVEDMKAVVSQVEDLKAELLIQNHRMKTISTVLNVENITDLDAEIARVAEAVYESHVPPKPEVPQDDPSDPSEAGPPRPGHDLRLSSSGGLDSGAWCLHSRLWVVYREGTQPEDWEHLESSAYYYYHRDEGIGWRYGCQKCTSGGTVRDPDILVWPYRPGVNFWHKCE